VILAPLLLKTVGPPTLFAVCGALYVIGAGFAFLLPRLDEHVAALRRRRPTRSIREGLLNGWRSIRSDHITYEALADDVLVGVGLSSLVVIMPLYLKGVLGTAAENTVFVFAPAALGLVAGLRFAPRIGRAVGEQRTAVAGLLCFSFCVASLGFVVQTRAFLNDTIRIPIDPLADSLGIPPLVLLTMLISIPAGFASSLVSVSARAVLLARTPATLRGQVLATQSLMGNIGALGPTLLAGIAADVFGVERIAVAIAVLIAGCALTAHVVTRRPVPVPSTTT
jgi:MFS family permease